MADSLDEVDTYPVSPARMRAMQEASVRAGAGGIPVAQGVTPPLAQAGAQAPAAVGGLSSLNMNAILQQMQLEAQARRAAQQEQMSLINQQASRLGQGGISDLDRASMLFQAAGALAAPTRTGSFMESLGAAGTAVAGPLAKAAQAERERQDKIAQLQLVRAKLAGEMGTGDMSSSDMLQLMKARAEMTPKPSEKERLYQMWQTEQNPQRKKALSKMLGIGDEDEAGELKSLTLPDGTSMSVIMSGGRALDPITRQPLTPEIIAGRSASSPEARRAESEASGIPMPERDIFRNLPPKTREAARAKTIETATKVLDNLEKAAPESNLQKDISDTGRFLRLNEANEKSTGPFMGILPSVTEAAKEMDAIGASMARKMREPGEGATSDYDAKMFQRMTLSTSNPYAVNRNIGSAIIAQRNSEISRREFMREYLSQNGTLDGAQKYWNQYLKSNPIFAPDQEKADVRNIRLNDKRQDWRDFFMSGGKQEKSGEFVRGPGGKLILRGQ